MFVYRVFLEESLADLWRCSIIREEEEEERLSSIGEAGGMNVNVDDDDVDMMVMMNLRCGLCPTLRKPSFLPEIRKFGNKEILSCISI